MDLGALQKAAYITIPGVNGGLSAPVEPKLTVGRQVGELLVDHPSISPRHCTFIRDKDVITVIDHSSASGTYINGKKLESGKTYILNASDEIKLGELKTIVEFLDIPASGSAVDSGILNTAGIAGVEFTNTSIDSDSFAITDADLESDDDQATQGLSELSLDIPSDNVEVDPTAEMTLSEPKFPDLSDLDMPEVPADATAETNMGFEIGEQSLHRGSGRVDIKTLMTRAENDELDDEIEEDIVESELMSLSRKANNNKGFNIGALDVEEVELDPFILQAYRNSGASRFKLRRNKSKVVKSSGAKSAKKRKVYKPFLEATNVVFRFFALCVDFLVSYTVINIFYVFIDFQNFFNQIPTRLGELLKPVWESSLKGVFQEVILAVPEIDGLVNDIVAYPDLNWVISVISVVLIFRILTTALLGVSFGNFILGTKSFGAGFKVRALGILREIIGIFTAPFIVFDLPTFVFRRSFKEVITRTYLYSPSRLFSFLLALIMVPIFLVIFLLSPLVKGLEFLPPIPVEEINIKNGPWQYKNKVYSQLLGMSYDMSEDMATLPLFQIEIKKLGDKSKRFLTFGLSFIDLNDGNSFEIRKVKEYSSLSIYKDFVRLNYLSQYFQPQIYGLVHDVSLKNKNFKSNASNKLAIAVETQNIIKSIFPLELDNVYDFVINNGPMIAGHRDFREKMENLIGHKIKRLILTNFAGEECLIAHHQQGSKQFYSILPLGGVNEQVFVTSLDVVSPKNKLLVGPFRFSEYQPGQKYDVISKFTAGFKQNANFEDFELGQVVYERYFSAAKTLLTKNLTNGIQALEKSISQTLAVLGENKEKNQKLFLNLSELLENLKNKNENFFGINQTQTVSL